MANFRNIERKIIANGWFLVRINGSHHMYKNHHNDLTITVPNHNGKDISIGLIRSLEKNTGLSLRK